MLAGVGVSGLPSLTYAPRLGRLPSRPFQVANDVAAQKGPPRQSTPPVARLDKEEINALLRTRQSVPRMAKGLGTLVPAVYVVSL